ncbi:hypothetical protein O181_039037 [Austropuccinia psidii MF-1]|uniref:Uncharacterized protein n=1 Tax=Austropuccinia psidii MF-1 TaxID=1389203 RepID=A0A9Q3DFY5_9BASI|nr:hypothetical protein [Austropuccinia psidii MF-1]
MDPGTGDVKISHHAKLSNQTNKDFFTSAPNKAYRNPSEPSPMCSKPPEVTNPPDLSNDEPPPEKQSTNRTPPLFQCFPSTRDTHG